MKRIAGCFLCASLLVGLAGCDSGTGGGEGLPKDMTPATPTVIPPADMGKQKVNVNALPKGSDTGEPVTPKK